MNDQYQLADGSPRYGHRTDTLTETMTAVRVEEAAEGAALLGLDDVAAAIDRRLGSAWADAEDPAVTALRKEHPEELAAAHALVKLHLGTQRQWRLKAQAVREKQLEGLVARRRATGSIMEILALRLAFMAALIALPAYLVVTDQNDLVKLLITGVLCLVAALAGGHFLTNRARIPVMPAVRGSWLNELREDVVNATLVAILQNKGIVLAPDVAAAGRRGWASIQDASKAVAALRS